MAIHSRCISKFMVNGTGASCEKDILYINDRKYKLSP